MWHCRFEVLLKKVGMLVYLKISQCWTLYEVGMRGMFQLSGLRVSECSTRRNIYLRCSKLVMGSFF